MRAPVPRDAASPPVISLTPCARVAEHRQRPAAQHAPHRLAVDVAELLRARDRRLRPLRARPRARAGTGARRPSAPARSRGCTRGWGRAPARARASRAPARCRDGRGTTAPGPPSRGTRRRRCRRAWPGRSSTGRARRRSSSNSATPRSAYSSARANEPWWNRLQASSSDDSSSCSSIPLGASRWHSTAMSWARENSPRSSYSVASASSTETSGSLSESRRGEAARAQQRVLGLGRRPAAGRHERLPERRQQLDLGARALGLDGQLGRRRRARCAGGGSPRRARCARTRARPPAAGSAPRARGRGPP